MTGKGHRRHSQRSVGWKQRQNWNTRAQRQEHGNTVIDRAMGRTWTSEHGEWLRTALLRSTETERWYVWRKPGGSWQLGHYTVKGVDAM